MQSESIILISPTHEQSVFTFQVQQSWTEDLLKFLATKGITPWRPPTEQVILGPDGKLVVEIEVDVPQKEVVMDHLVKEFSTLQADSGKSVRK